MITKENIMDTINVLEEDLRVLKAEQEKDYPNIVKDAIKKEIWDVDDNLYRYKMQAKAWKLL